MGFLDGFALLLVERGLALILGVTAVLAVGSLAVLGTRHPLHRERCAELTLLGAVLAFVLLLLPLPGPVGQWLGGGGSPLAGLDSLDAEQSRALDAPLRFESGEAEPGAVSPPVPNQRSESQASATTGRPALPMGELVAVLPASTGPAPAQVALIALGLGSLVMLLHLLASAWALGRLGRRAGQVPDWLRAECPEPTRARVLLCARSPRPFCFGWLRATIVLPAALVQPENRELLKAVLAHESAHVRLGHIRWRQWVAVCAVLLYAHPLFWWLAHQQREAAELLADDQAARSVGKLAYVEQLIALVEQLRSQGSYPSLGALRPLSVLGAPERADGPFYQRMRSLLMRPNVLSTRSSLAQRALRGLSAAGLLGAVALAWGRPATAQSSPQREGSAAELLAQYTFFAGEHDPAAQLSTSRKSSYVEALKAMQGGDKFGLKFRVDKEGLGGLLCGVVDMGYGVDQLKVGPAGEDGLRDVSLVVTKQPKTAPLKQGAGGDVWYYSRLQPEVAAQAGPESIEPAEPAEPREAKRPPVDSTFWYAPKPVRGYLGAYAETNPQPSLPRSEAPEQPGMDALLREMKAQNARTQDALQKIEQLQEQLRSLREQVESGPAQGRSGGSIFEEPIVQDFEPVDVPEVQEPEQLSVERYFRPAVPQGGDQER